MALPTLLEGCLDALAACLAGRPSSARSQLINSLAAIPEPALARGLWRRYQALLAQRQGTPAYAEHLPVATAFAAAGFWAPRALVLAGLPDERHALAQLPAAACRLEHLALALALPPPSPAGLAPLATCARLRCLSLRGCAGLADGDLAALAGCTALRALDLGGLAQLGDGAAAHAARCLPALEHLNLSHTAASDAALEALTYGQRLAAWAAAQPPPQLQQQAAPGQRGSVASATAAAAGPSVPPEAVAWLPLPLAVLRLAGTRVTPGGLLHLRDLPRLTLLDVRHTLMPRAALQPLEQRFGLRLVQGSVLSASNALAAAVVNHDAVACTCQPQEAGAPEPSLFEEEWAVEGALLLLHACPSRSIAGLLEGPPPGAGAPAVAGGAEAAGESAQQLRRRGYRAPRPPEQQAQQVQRGKRARQGTGAYAQPAAGSQWPRPGSCGSPAWATSRGYAPQPRPTPPWPLLYAQHGWQPGLQAQQWQPPWGWPGPPPGLQPPAPQQQRPPPPQQHPGRN